VPLQNVFGDLALDASIQALLATSPSSGYDNGNIRITPMGANETFTGAWRNIEHAGAVLFVWALLAIDGQPVSVAVEYSDDGAAPNGRSTALTGKPVTSGGLTFNVWLLIQNGQYGGKYYRVKVVQGATPTSLGTPLNAALVDKFPFGGSFVGLDDALTIFSQGLLTRAVQAGVDPNGDFLNTRTQGSLASNSSNLPLMAGAVFRGVWFPWQTSYIKLIVDMHSDVAGTLYVDFSELDTPTDSDETSVNDSVALTYDPLSEPLLKRQVPVQSKWVRLRYVNGIAGQTEMLLDAALVTSDPGLATQALIRVPRLLTQAGIVRNVQALPNGLGTGYQEVPVDGSGVPYVRVQKVDDDLLLRGLPTAQVRQLVVGTTPVQLDLAKLAGRRYAAIANLDEGTTPQTLWVGHSSGISADSGTFPVYGKGEKGGAYGPNVDLWAVLRNTGGVQAVLTRSGSTATGTATSPSNALSSDDVNTSVVAAGQTCDVSGFTAGTTNTLVKVQIGMEGHKQAGQFETVTHQETQAAAQTTGSLVSPALAGGAGMLYLCRVTRNDNAGTVTSVTGLGLTWVALQTNITAGNRRIDLWYAYGAATAGAVTATLSASTNAHIAVSRYANADPTTPIQASGSNTGTGTNVTGPTLPGTNKGYSSLATSHTSSATPGVGYTETYDNATGTGSNIDGLETESKALTATGNETASATLATSVAWAAVGVTIAPRPAIDPVVTLSHSLGATTGTLTLTSTTDNTTKVDVTGDRAWVVADIPSLHVVATGTTIGAAAALVDYLFVELTDSTQNTVRVTLREIA
jgi:hypothetical protein